LWCEVAREAPRIVSATATSTSLHVRWSAPFFVGAPLIGYRLSVSAAAAAASQQLTERVKEVLVQRSAPPVMSEVVTLLQPDTDYTLSVAALNQFGAGDPSTVTVRTLPHSALRQFTATTSLLLSSTASIHGQLPPLATRRCIAINTRPQSARAVSVLKRCGVRLSVCPVGSAQQQSRAAAGDAHRRLRMTRRPRRYLSDCKSNILLLNTVIYLVKLHTHTLVCVVLPTALVAVLCSRSAAVCVRVRVCSF